MRPAWSPRGPHCFVAPPLDGPITGGTLYDRELVAALGGATELVALALGSAELEPALARAACVWIDSLYLEAVPELSRRISGRRALILHYLPAFVELGRAALRSELSDSEQRALDAVDAFLVPSAFMRDAIEAIVAPQPKKIFVVEPGTSAALAPRDPVDSTELRAISIGNVVPGKGIEPWLRALAAELSPSDRLSVSIVGSLDADSAYAARCRCVVSAAPLLRERVRFFGVRSHSETLQLLARADLFVSASRMESYGIALSEARVSGIPILARSGGNAAAHVSAEAGGELVADEAGLARSLVTLARNSAAFAERRRAARTRALPARSWREAARRFLDQLATCEK